MKKEFKQSALSKLEQAFDWVEEDIDCVGIDTQQEYQQFVQRYFISIDHGFTK